MTPDEVPVEIHKVGHRWVDISVAACALIVSVTSLLVAIRHGRSMERMAEANAKLVEANSWPMLQWYHSDFGKQPNTMVFSLNVVNSGVGPAKVESLELAWRGVPVSSAHELLETCCRQGTEVPGSSLAVTTSSLMGTVLRAGEVRTLIEFPEDSGHAYATHQLGNALQDVSWRACYCSVFDECWVSDLHSLHPQNVKACPVPKRPFRG
jgi:hypothetical protein